MSITVWNRILSWWHGTGEPTREDINYLLEKASSARCQSDTGPRQRHLYNGAPACVRCGARNPYLKEPTGA